MLQALDVSQFDVGGEVVAGSSEVDDGPSCIL
jgi:hypothetical protein